MTQIAYSDGMSIFMIPSDANGAPINLLDGFASTMDSGMTRPFDW